MLHASHNIRGIHLGQDRYKRRYFVLPNAGGVYVEGLESGYFDESLEKNIKKEDNKMDVKPSNLFSFKSDKQSNGCLASQQKLTTTLPLDPQPAAVKIENCDNFIWFSIVKKATCCDGIKSVPSKNPIHTKIIIAPSVEQLGQDKKFLESIYGNDMATPSLLPNSQVSQSLSKASMLLGLPENLDISNLIENPQKVAELLEFQSAVAQEIPTEMKNGWWRVTDPDLLQQITCAAHQR